ncbi:DUF4407 domain-containing protein, partial [Patescibacteria group bacterium]|nr:DUF4407 domain-containing protein [Patescibacteria group bacterium]
QGGIVIFDPEIDEVLISRAEKKIDFDHIKAKAEAAGDKAGVAGIEAEYRTEMTLKENENNALKKDLKNLAVEVKALQDEVDAKGREINEANHALNPSADKIGFFGRVKRLFNPKHAELKNLNQESIQMLTELSKKRQKADGLFLRYAENMATIKYLEMSLPGVKQQDFREQLLASKGIYDSLS